MTTPTHSHSHAFTDAIDSMMEELLATPNSTDTILRLLINNLDSPVLAKIQHLSLSWLNTDQMTSLLPALAKMVNLVTLALGYSTLSSDHFTFLFTECHALSKLQSLDLCYVPDLYSEDLLALSQSTILTNLTFLNLNGCGLTATTSRVAAALSQSENKPGSDVSGLVALLSSPFLKNVVRFDFPYGTISDPLVCNALFTSPFLSNLAYLDLHTCKFNSDIIAALTASTTLRNLTHLGLKLSQLGDESIARLLSPPSLLAKKLQSLDLTACKITVTSLQLLVQTCPHLSELDLTLNYRLGPAGIRFIATSMPNLTKLNLSLCDIRDEGYAILAASTALYNLRDFNANCNQAQAESIIALVNSGAMANLTHLDFTHTYKGPEVLTAIAQSPSMSKLQHLKFKDNGIGDKGVMALAQSTTLTNLTFLDLGYNGIGQDGAMALCTSPVVSKLTSLTLTENPEMGNSVSWVLAATSSTLYNLLELNLCNTGLDDVGVLQLLESSNLDQVNSLIVSLNPHFSSEEIRVLHKSRFDRGL